MLRLCHASMHVDLFSCARPLIRREFLFFLLIFSPFNVGVEHSACAVDTLCRPVLPVHDCSVVWLRSDIGAHRVGTSFPSAGDIRGHIAPCPLSVLRVCTQLQVLSSDILIGTNLASTSIAHLPTTNVIVFDYYSFLRRLILINTSLSICHRRFN